MKKIILGVCCLFLVLFISGCDKQKTLKIELEGNATTGYMWTYTVDKEGIIKETHSEYKQNVADEQMTGVPGTFIFEFEGVQKGEVTLTFVYSQTWETVEPLQTKVYKVIVESNKTIKLSK